MLIFVTGGSGCGKSTFAERSIAAGANQNRIYLATMEVYDEEWAARVRRHRAARAGLGYRTIEAQRDILSAAEQVPWGAVVLLDCLCNLTANELFSPEGVMDDPDAVLSRILAGLCRLCERAGELWVVSNEIGADGIDYGPASGAYIRCLGALNRAVAARADTVWEVVCGIPLRR